MGCAEGPGGVCSVWDMLRVVIDPFLVILTLSCWLFWQVEERRKKYLDSYDIVLESDETLDVVNGVLRYLLAET